MQQLTQNLKNGKMDVLEVPYPSLSDNQLLVRNLYSVISAGTEGRSVRDARANYIGKAKSRPNEVKQVLNTVKTQGVIGTYKIVMDKLNSLSYLGYCCAGEVIEVGDSITKFKVGDVVACGGQGAAHAEVVSVLENLCVKIPEDVDIRHASFATIASIAIQGIRQADNRIGESCLIIGLGLLGQFTIQILNAAGIKTIGVDIDKDKVVLAKQNGCDLVLHREDSGLIEQIIDFSDGNGVDSVIITAATNSNDPVNLAGEVCRMKAKVISVGRISTDFNRDLYYNKELELLMSCSYGPGRYDVSYEEKGVDYPIGYVRWTENRNMKAYIDLLSTKRIDIESLITHTFKFSEASKGYELIMNNTEPYLGMLLKYNNDKPMPKRSFKNDKVTLRNENIKIGFIGAGSFARSFLLPNFPKNIDHVAVATSSGHNARHVANKFNFKNAVGSGDEIIMDKNINTVFIATRHNTHAKYVIESLKNGKNVFVEKPLCMNIDELEIIKKEYDKRNQHLMVGFNRRFSPLIKKSLKILGKDTKKTINYRINVGHIDPNHWTQDKTIGGGRIIGEVCHFLDLCMYIAGAKPTKLSSFVMDDPNNLDDTVVVNIKFNNGSIATISYFTNGSKMLEKEYLEIYSNGTTTVLEDYKKLTVYGEKKKTFKTKQDKGHRQELLEYFNALINGKKCPISFEDIYWSTKMTFDVIKSIRQSETISYE